VRRLGEHPRRSCALDGRRRAAVAVVLVDSDAARHDGDPVLAADVDMSVVPGQRTGLDGRMVGVAGGAAFLLWRRAPRLHRHAGSAGAAGGRVDEGETAPDAALCEVDEELGLRLTADSVLGWLDDYPTRSGYVISPGVLWGDADPAVRPRTRRGPSLSVEPDNPARRIYERLGFEPVGTPGGSVTMLRTLGARLRRERSG